MTNINEELDIVCETSWEVCNKVGGIYTVLSTKAAALTDIAGDKIVFIGPDMRVSGGDNIAFIEEQTPYSRKLKKIKLPYEIKVRIGRWDIPGSPVAILVDYKGVFPHLNAIYGRMWDNFGVDSLHSYGDYDESCAFAIASAEVIKALIECCGSAANRTIAHFNEWTVGMGLLWLRLSCPQVATIFTTHATSIGRSICGNGKQLYKYFHGYYGDQMASELNMEAKHSLEKQAARISDCFTTVSKITADECGQLLDKYPDVVTPNGFENRFVWNAWKSAALRKTGRKKLFDIVERLTGHRPSEDALLIATSGRNEYRNKGLDIFLDSLNLLRYEDAEKEIVGLVLVPSWIKEADPCFNSESAPASDFCTHRLNNEDSDKVMCRIRDLGGNMVSKDVQIIYLPAYLTGDDGVLNLDYYSILPALDLTVFPSYYEPWGYTPLESIAFGVPTITTDKSGFGRWVESEIGENSDKTGVKVISRNDDSYWDTAKEIASTIKEYAVLDEKSRKRLSKSARITASLAQWNEFIKFYLEAFDVALKNARLREDAI